MYKRKKEKQRKGRIDRKNEYSRPIDRHLCRLRSCLGCETGKKNEQESKKERKKKKRKKKRMEKDEDKTTCGLRRILWCNP